MTNLYSNMKSGQFSSIDQVIGITERYENLVQASQDSESAQMQELLNNLATLKAVLEKQEMSFYNKLQIPGYSNLKGMNTRAKEWSSSGAQILLKHDFIQTTYQRFVARIDEKELLNAVNIFLSTLSPEEVLLADDKQSVSQFLNDYFKIEKNKFSSASSIGINASLKIINNGNGFQAEFIGKMSESTKKKLLSYINPILQENEQVNIPKKEYQSILEEIRMDLRNQGINGEIYSRINYEFTKRASNYNKAPNFFVIQGWFGEVYWNAKMNYLLHTTATYPTGDLKNEQGQSTSVDMIIGDTGFQIKSWAVKEVGGQMIHKSSKKMQLGNFLEGRMEAMNTAVGIAIAEMFGAITYNKPNAEYANAMYGFYEGFYSSRMRPKASNPYALENIMNAYLNKIIRIDAGGTLKNPPIGLKKSYLNTFWLINDDIIPSSLIIQNIIDRIKGEANSTLVDITLTNIEESKSTPVWPDPIEYGNLTKIANRWTIYYDITFNFTEIMNSIASTIKA